MKTYSKTVFSCVLTLGFCILQTANCQLNTIDSLKLALKNSRQDTNRLRLRNDIGEICSIFRIGYWDSICVDAKKLKIKKIESMALNNIGFIYYNQGNIPKALDYYDRSLKTQEEMLQTAVSQTQKNDIKKDLANSLNNIGATFDNQGDIPKALNYYDRSLKMEEEIGDKKGIANSLNNMGLVYYRQGDISKALNYYERSLKILEEIGNQKGLANTLNNIGLIYFSQGDFPIALNYFRKSLFLWQKTGDKEGSATTFNNIGNIYRNQGDTSKALHYYHRSLKLQEEIGYKEGISNTLNYMGAVYQNHGSVAKALEYYERSLKLRQEIGVKRGIVESLRNMGSAYFKLASNGGQGVINKNKIQLALSYSNKALMLSKELGFPENILEAEFTLSEINSATKNYHEAFEHYKQYIIYRDSIVNETTRKSSTKSQLKYEYEKKEAVIKEQQDKERAVAQEKNRFQQIIIASVVVGLLLVIIFAAFVFRSLKITHKQKIIIEGKQNEILDSIHYAKKIQRSLMPTEKYIDKALSRITKK